MTRITRKQFDRMMQDRPDHLKTLLNTPWRSGQIYKQRTAANAADAAGQHRERSFSKSLAAHSLCKAGCFPLDNCLGRLGRIIPRAKPGPAGCQYKVYVIALGQNVERIPQIVQIIRNDDLPGNFRTGFDEQFRQPVT
jgi:hypothetical protein